MTKRARVARFVGMTKVWQRERHERSIQTYSARDEIAKIEVTRHEKDKTIS
jgi:hypothetical protein